MPRDTNTRESLIESTQSLMWERGFAAMSPRAILDRAGAGQGSMYHHFQGKEALAAVALERSADDLFDRAASALAGAGSAFARVSAYLVRQREVLRGCPVGRLAGDVEVLESSALHAVLAETFERIRALIVDVIDAGVAAGEFRPGLDSAQLADTVLAVVQGGYVLARAAGDAAPFDRAVHGAVALLGFARSEAHS